jgi:hypothetical protein
MAQPVLYNAGRECRKLHETQFPQGCTRFTALNVWHYVDF